MVVAARGGGDPAITRPVVAVSLRSSLSGSAYWRSGGWAAGCPRQRRPRSGGWSRTRSRCFAAGCRCRRSPRVLAPPLPRRIRSVRVFRRVFGGCQALAYYIFFAAVNLRSWRSKPGLCGRSSLRRSPSLEAGFVPLDRDHWPSPCRAALYAAAVAREPPTRSSGCGSARRSLARRWWRSGGWAAGCPRQRHRRHAQPTQRVLGTVWSAFQVLRPESELRL